MLLTNYLRIFSDVSGSLKDLSIENSEWSEFSFDATNSEYLYVAQAYPFNNLYLECSTGNVNTANIEVEFWNGKQWASAVDVLDGTSVSGSTLQRPGVIQWGIDIDGNPWDKIQDTSDQNEPSELQSLKIYDLWWVRLSPSQNLSAGTKLKRINYLFCTNQQLLDHDPEINNYLEAWGGVAKTDWTDQIIAASQHVVTHLKAKGVLNHQAQILRFDDFSIAATYKTLSFIYARLGSSYAEKRDYYEQQFKDQMNLVRFTGIDNNSNGRVDQSEIAALTARAVR